ncbi:MAG TPA: GH25 family lysozyme, partial [Beijerinckiaceae bacterium]|nr:GH25 family lysozyme [Beijerinckiaceae bacterium]
QVLPELRSMLSELERHYGKRPVIYSSVDFYQAILAPNELDDYPIWIRSTKYSPHVKYGNRAWHFWQYQSDGSVPGIAGKVDRNAFFGDRKQWVAWLQGNERRGPVPPANAVAVAAEPSSPEPAARAPIPRTSVLQAPMTQAARLQTSALQPMQLLPMSLNDGPHY